MRSKIIELKPKRDLLNPDFEGYKVSLTAIPTIQEDLLTPVDSIKPDLNQYSLLHAKLFGLHNHLVGENFNNTSIYFVDEQWNIQRYYVDSNTDQLINETVWDIPSKSLRKPGDYNVSIKFINQEIVAVGDGMGCLYLLQHSIPNCNRWKNIFEGEIIEPPQNFVVVDGKMLYDKNEIHVLVLGIKQKEDNNQNTSLLYWIVLSKDEDGWNQVALKQLESTGFYQYAYFESDCEAVHVASDTLTKFTLDSEKEVDDLVVDDSVGQKFEWTQTTDEINIKFILESSASGQNVSAVMNPGNIQFKHENDLLLEGELYHKINVEESTWYIDNCTLNIVLQKAQKGLMWPEVVEGSGSIGEYKVDQETAEQVNNTLSPLTSDSVSDPPSGITFNSQQIEECDFECDQSTIFQRIGRLTHISTHKSNFGSHQILFNLEVDPKEPPAFGIRSDVDCCLYQPKKTSDNFSIEHVGTLNALGYIQASKPQKKFITCAPDMSYFVISETSKHIFIYFQNRDISSSDLRNRRTGRRVRTMAQQHIFSLTTNDEVLGLYASNTHLFILTKTYITTLKL